MTEIVKAQASEADIILALKTSLYPGASDESVGMVMAYCRASKLDPMQKPVHIVPIYDRAISGMRDTVMPGIGLYRIQAARSGRYAGMSDPEFGPTISTELGGEQISYPEYCKITVRRQMETGEIVEYWIENYAQKGGKAKSIAANAMWTRRPFAQLAKCAEAQALRRAFPEMTGSQPTAEEMEGKEYDITPPAEAKTDTAPAAKPPYTAEKFEQNMLAWRKLVESGDNTAKDIVQTVSTRWALSPDQVQAIYQLQPIEQG